MYVEIFFSSCFRIFGELVKVQTKVGTVFVPKAEVDSYLENENGTLKLSLICT